MSHPIPGHGYNEKRRGLTPSKLKAYSHKLLKEGGVVSQAKHLALQKKLQSKKEKKLPLSRRIDYYKTDPGFRDDQD